VGRLQKENGLVSCGGDQEEEGEVLHGQEGGGVTSKLHVRENINHLRGGKKPMVRKDSLSPWGHKKTGKS